MSYTPPAVDAVDFELVAYTPPAVDAVNFDFYAGVTVPIVVESTTIANSAGSGVTSLTYSHDHTAGNRLFVTIGQRYIGSIVTVTYGGVAMTEVGREANGSSVENFVFQLDDPPTGVNDVVMTSSISRRTTSGAISVSGVDTVRAVGSVSLAETTDPQTAVIDVTAVAGDFLVRSDHWAASNHDVQSVGGGLDDWLDDAGVNGQPSRGAMSWGEVVSTSGGEASPSMTLYSSTQQNYWAGIAVSIKPALASGSGPTPPYLQLVGGGWLEGPNGGFLRLAP